MDKGPWVLLPDSTTVWSEDFKHDARVLVRGDFESDEQELEYSQWLRDTLNASRWQPIDTAPKDGTWVLLGIVGRNEVLLAYWHRLFAAWWGQGGSSGEWQKWQRATHWRPMPEPPKSLDNVATP